MTPTSGAARRTGGFRRRNGRREKRDGGEYSQDIRATGHRDSYDSARSLRLVSCFAPVSLLLFLAPACVRLVAFVHLLCGASALVFCSCFHRNRITQPSLSLESSSNVLLLLLRLLLRVLPSRPLPHPLPLLLLLLLLVHSLASSRSPFFCSLFRERVEVIFLPARRAARPGGRGGERRARERCSISPLLGLKGADVTYGSRPDCTQLFRRAILMPWTPLANHPPPSSPPLPFPPSPLPSLL